MYIHWYKLDVVALILVVQLTVSFFEEGFSDKVMIDMAIYLVRTGITPVVDMNSIDRYKKRHKFVTFEQNLRDCLIKKYPGEYQNWKFEKLHVELDNIGMVVVT